jgi:hypothetical protein
MLFYLEVPESNLDNLRKKVAALNKRAEKAGTPLIEVSISQEVFYKKTTDGVSFRYRKVALSGDSPVFDGYSFVAVLEPSGSDGENIIKRAPSKEEELPIPPKYRTSGTFCDHCKKSRSRSETILIHSDEGGFMQVGKSCLGDFLDKESLQRLAFWSEIDWSDLRSTEEEGSFTSQESFFDTERMILLASRVISLYGYLSNKNASSANSSTAGRMQELLCFQQSLASSVEREAHKQLADKLKPSDEDIAFVPLFKSWLQNAADSDYIHNIRLLVKTPHVSLDKLSLLASAVFSAKKDLGELKERSKEPFLDEYFGVPKTRYKNQTLILRKRIATTGFRDEDAYLYLFRDTEGRQFSWFSGKELDSSIKDGNEMVCDYTVKEHRVYKERKVTIITRLSLSGS